MCFTCPIVLSNASIPQWPVGSNGVFLTGRWGVSHMVHMPKMDYLSRNNTLAPWHGFQWTFIVPYLPIQPPFLSGRLGVIGVPHWPVGSLPYNQPSGLNYMVKHYTSSPPPPPPPPPRDGFQCLMRFTCPILLSNAAIPQWSVGSNGCSSVAGWEYHTWCIYQERIICPKIKHQGPQTLFSTFNVFHVSHIAVKCSHSSVASLE